MLTAAAPMSNSNRWQGLDCRIDRVTLTDDMLTKIDYLLQVAWTPAYDSDGRVRQGCVDRRTHRNAGAACGCRGCG